MFKKAKGHVAPFFLMMKGAFVLFPSTASDHFDIFGALG
jgi:hypothetical protein